MDVSEICKKHRGEAVYCVKCYDLEEKRFERETDITRHHFFLTYDEALEAARKEAEKWAYMDEARKVDTGKKQPPCLICIVEGMKVSKKGTMYGYHNIIYMIANDPKEYVDKFKMDTAFKALLPVSKTQ